MHFKLSKCLLLKSEFYFISRDIANLILLEGCENNESLK